MEMGQKPSWTFIFGIVIPLFFASVLVTSEVAFRKDGVDPNYASLLKECKKIKLPNGTVIQTVPKLLQTPLVTACSTWKSKYGPPLRQAVCRFPDCLSNPCQYGWCEETLQGYQCLCFPGFRGKYCSERWTLPTDGTSVSSSDSSHQSATSPTSTSGLPITTGSTTPTNAKTITPSDSTLQVTPSTSPSGPPTTTGSSAKVFITDANAEAIFFSELHDELNFTSIPSTSFPTFIKYDPTERHIYWSDSVDLRVYRANLDGTDQEQVTAGSTRPRGIAVAERSRILYIAYPNGSKVTSMSIERGSPLPGIETDFVSHGIYNPRALIIDEEEGFLYISKRHGIVRALLNATNDIEKIYRNTALWYLSGLSIDLTRHPRRIFFSDWYEKRTFYKELSTGPNSDTSTAVELTGYTQNPFKEKMTDVKYFNNTLYWVKSNDPKGIGIMTNYDQTNRTYRVQEISQFKNPQKMFITFAEP